MQVSYVDGDAYGPDGSRQPRNIILLSDGTGNSSKALFRTNVWRLYQALDLRNPEAQVAYYDDGVGTSSFRPLALLGGVFGWGLKRNVLELYSFLCRHYRPGDRIHVFGFSRGAFTARVLCGLITRVGIVKHDECDLRREDRLDLAARDAYRTYRSFFNQTGGLVSLFRLVRNQVIRAKRGILGQKIIAKEDLYAEQPIKFLGVWDTVSAYGMPIDEMTRAIDDWLWPLSMPNRLLNGKVERACHALALDDERESFHPLLWSEAMNLPAEIDDDTSASQHIDGERISQVWFPGAHSDIGGGYPDDSLAHVTLQWMIDRIDAQGAKQGARASDALQLLPNARREIGEKANPLGPLHDSRQGLAGYYRYTPRDVTRLCHRKAPWQAWRAITSRLFGGTRRPPTDDAFDSVHIKRPKIHESVFHRIRNGVDGYAPFNLPERFGRVTRDGAVETVDISEGEQAPGRESYSDPKAPSSRDRVWNIVWMRRVVYFATVLVSMFLVLFPLLQARSPDSACEDVPCMIAPAVSALKFVLPGIAAAWLDAFAAWSGLFLLAAGALTVLLLIGGSLQRRIADGMKPYWGRIYPVYACSPDISQNLMHRGIFRLRTNAIYKSVFYHLKFTVAPAIFALLFSALFVLAVTMIIATAYERYSYVKALKNGEVCKVASPDNKSQSFRTSNPCFDTGFDVRSGQSYFVYLTISEPWFDRSIATDPRGIQNSSLTQKFASPLLRVPSENYFMPIAHVGQAGEVGTPLQFTKSAEAGANRFRAEFKAPQSGRLFLYVNDALYPSVLSWIPTRLLTVRENVARCPNADAQAHADRRWRFYANNCGAAAVDLRELGSESIRR